jgi:hypothetical protein
MSARTKLNVAAINGALLVAAPVGWLFGSWSLFLLTATVLIAMGLHAGDIRMDRRR